MMEWLIWIIGVVLGIFALLFVLAYKSSRKRLIVSPGHVGLLYRSGKLERELEPGEHRWTDWDDSTMALRVPMMQQFGRSAHVEAMSSDRFSYRLELTPITRITDPRAWFESHEVNDKGDLELDTVSYPDVTRALSALAQDYVGRFTMDETIEKRSEMLDGLAGALNKFAPGGVVEEVLVSNLTLPPEIRKMYTQVERVKREGQAALEKARAEQAALRALANAARQLESNPGLAQLRLIQTMEGPRGQKSFVIDANAIAKDAAVKGDSKN